MSVRPTRSRVLLLPAAWSLILAAVMLGPALAPGFVLIRDMVFVPDLHLGRSDVMGLGPALPRAVPSDAVVAAMDDLVAGMVLQKIILLASLGGAGLGFATMVGGGLVARLVAVSVAVWNPFVVERLAIGHWPVLVGYAALPWLIVAGRRVASGGAVPFWVPLVVLAGSLSANAGIVSALALLITACAGGVRRPAIALVGLIVTAANAPWIIAGVLAASDSLSTGGFHAFSTRGDGLPAVLTIVTGGGIWNGAAVPPSREGVLAWVAFGGAITVAGLGARRWWAASRRAGEATALTALWGIGVGLALLSAVAPGLLASLSDQVPGLGLLRDGTRSLALAMPLTVGLISAGAAVLVERPQVLAGRISLVVAAALAPVAVMPDAAWGLAGELRAVEYPHSWVEARAVVDPAHGDAVVLPWAAFRAPAWNGGRPVQDPMPRFLRAETIGSSDLVVSDAVVAGEDRRAQRVGRALRLKTVSERTEALLDLGIGWIVTDTAAGPAVPGIAPVVNGTVVLDRTDLTVVRVVGTPSAHLRSAGSQVAQGVGWTAFAGLTVIGVLLALGRGGVRILTRRNQAARVRRLTGRS